MAIPTLRPEEYLNLRLQSKHRCLLVEGAFDKALFERFLLAFCRELRRSKPDIQLPTIVVDSAADLVTSGIAGSNGNRETVEAFCNLLMSGERGIPASLAEQVVGFVDREFRGFQIARNKPLEDEIGEHYVLGRLVWSRGHSVENYLFSFEALQPYLSGISNFPQAAKALSHFECVFDSALRVACALSLAGFLVDNRLQLVRNSIDARYFLMSDSEVRLDTFSWRARLEAKAREQQIMTDTVSRIIEEFEFWIEQVRKVEASVIQWLCHGHIGFSVLLAVYEQCIAALDEQSALEGDILSKTRQRGGMKARNRPKISPRSLEDHQHMCSQIWIERAILTTLEFPWPVVQLLNLPLTQKARTP